VKIKKMEKKKLKVNNNDNITAVEEAEKKDEVVVLEEVGRDEEEEEEDEIEGIEEEVCILCMEADDTANPLIQHNCPQCARQAWKICYSCNESLLSRTCPVCRSDYAPLLLYFVPG
jgi:hypothetical protein